MRIVWAVVIAGVAAFTLSVLAPLRQLSGDVVPGRMGGAVLRCAGDFDLSHVDWIDVQTGPGVHLYYTLRDQLGGETSVFGPAPAIVAMLALLDFGEGDRIADDTLRRRERGAGAVLLAIAVALVVLAAAARVTPLAALLAGIACAASFAGAATLGQGLWQATTALPCLAGAIAIHAWRERMPRASLAIPALLLVAAMLRPTIALLAIGIGIAWAREPRPMRSWLVAIGIALVAVAPLVVWNAIYLWSPFPIGQWTANARASEHVFTASGAAVGLAGLLVSPARGMLWFAPIALLGVVLALRDRTYRWFGIAFVLQLAGMALFFKWHGGMAYGPRLLAEAAWVGIWLALGTELRAPRWLVDVTLVITLVVGQLGLWRFRPEQWEMPVAPEVHPNAYWNITRSPIPATFTNPPATGPRAFDSPPVLGYICEGGRLRSAKAGEL